MGKTIILTESQYQKFKNFLSESITFDEITTEAELADKMPTEKQAEAGNYKMGHINVRGFKITIENAKGSKRFWKDDNGKERYNILKNHYGYFSNTKGHDGDHIDVFIGSYLDFERIYVVDQNYNDGSFDESKIMLGFKSKEQAKQAYLSNFDKEWKGFRDITAVSIDVFKKWLYDGHKQRKPFAKYVEIIKKKINESKDFF